MINILPTPPIKLFALGDMAADGCHKYEVQIELKQVTEAVLREHLANARPLNQEYQAAKAAKEAAFAALATADEEGTACITLSRDVLKPHLGSRWSSAWAEAGFMHHSLEIPKTQDERIEQLKCLELFFTAHPSLEVLPINVTAARAATLHTAFSNMISAASDARKVQEVTRKSRNEAVEGLRQQLRVLIASLKCLLGPDDPRWPEFGFNIPGAVPTPEAPTGLEVWPGITGHLGSRWNKPPGSDRFHVFKQLLNPPGEPQLADTVTDASADLNTFTSGQEVRLWVTAVNESGESLPSAAVDIVVP